MKGDTLEVLARKHAIKIADYCMVGVESPTDKINYYTPASIFVSAYLKQICIAALGLNEISESNYDEVVDKLAGAMKTIFLWTLTGWGIIFDEKLASPDNYPKSFWLAKYVIKNSDNKFIEENIHEC